MKCFALLLLVFVLSLTGICAAQADLLPGEPSSTGDGILPHEDFLKLIKWITTGYANGLLYEDVTAFIGKDGFDKGNRGPNSMTALGDHIFEYRDAEHTNYILLLTFRGREETGRFDYCQWSASGISSSEWENVDLTDWIKASTANIGVAPVSLEIQRFNNPLVTVTAEMPVTGWEAANFGSGEADYAQQLGQSYNYPKIAIKVYEKPEMFDFYINEYENIRDIGTRVIAGVPFSGRSYTYTAKEKDYIEYNLMLSANVGIQITIDRIDISEDMQGGRLLDSLCFSYTETDGTEMVFSGTSGMLPTVTATPTPEATAAPATPAPTAAPAVTDVPVVTDAPAPALAAEPSAAPSVSAPANQASYEGDWHGIYLHTGGMEGDPRSLFGLKITLTLKADGTGILDYAGSAEDGVWGQDEDGAVRFWGEGTPLTFQSDGSLLWGSYLSGYIIFSRDENAIVAVFPQDPSAQTAPVAAAPAATVRQPAASGAFSALMGKKYVATIYKASGTTMDAAMLGAEYAIVLKDDGTADFTMGGITTPGYTWHETDGAVKVGIYGSDLITITALEDDKILLDYSGAFELEMAAQ